MKKETISKLLLIYLIITLFMIFYSLPSSIIPSYISRICLYASIILVVLSFFLKILLYRVIMGPLMIKLQRILTKTIETSMVYMFLVIIPLILILLPILPVFTNNTIKIETLGQIFTSLLFFTFIPTMIYHACLELKPKDKKFDKSDLITIIILVVLPLGIIIWIYMSATSNSRIEITREFIHSLSVAIMFWFSLINCTEIYILDTKKISQ